MPKRLMSADDTGAAGTKRRRWPEMESQSEEVKLDKYRMKVESEASMGVVSAFLGLPEGWGGHAATAAGVTRRPRRFRRACALVGQGSRVGSKADWCGLGCPSAGERGLPWGAAERSEESEQPLVRRGLPM